VVDSTTECVVFFRSTIRYHLLIVLPRFRFHIAAFAIALLVVLTLLTVDGWLIYPLVCPSAEP
jgi:hypothetical protein